MTDVRGASRDIRAAQIGHPSQGAPLSVLIGLEGLALGGCPINALDLGRTLRDRGHRVTVFAIDQDVKVSLLPFAEAAGFTPVLLPTDAGLISRARQIRRLAKSVDADVTHVFGPWLGPAASVAMASGRRVAIVTNWTMTNVFYTPRHTPVVVGTQRLKDELDPRHDGQVYLIEPPVDLSVDVPDPSRGAVFRREWGIAADDLVVVVVGRVDAHMKAESLNYAVQAIRQVNEPRLRLVVVGDGDAFEQIRTVADGVNEDLGRRAVILTGSLLDTRPAYNAADVALGMGGSALRALAHGKPLVVLGEQGFARIFKPATVEYFYDVGFFGETWVENPVEHLTNLLIELFDKERRDVLGRFGLSEVRLRFGLDVGAANLEKIYRSSLEDLPAAGARFATAGAVVARVVARSTLDAGRGRGRPSRSWEWIKSKGPRSCGFS